MRLTGEPASFTNIAFGTGVICGRKEKQKEILDLLKANREDLIDGYDAIGKMIEKIEEIPE